MADVGLGQLITTTGRARSKALQDAVSDSHPMYAMMEENGGIRSIDGGRTVVEEAKTAQNSSVGWVAENGAASLEDQKVVDAAEHSWYYLLGSVSYTLAERYKNSGGSDTKFIDVIAGKFEVLEDTTMNIFHSGMLSNGTGSGGLQLLGLAGLVSTTPSTGTVGGIDRSNANAAWYRNQAATTTTAVSSATANVSNIKRILDYGIDRTVRAGKANVQCGLLGQTHWEFMTQVSQTVQVINDKSGTARLGFDKIIYRGVPLYHGGGINYSGESAVTSTYTYLLNVKRGGLNIVFHEKAKFDMLEPVPSADSPALARLMFTMVAMTLGGLAKFNFVIYNG